jgi:hypothetical protein
VTRLLRTGSTFSYTYKNASTSGEQFPTTPIESFGVTQNISLNRVNSTAQIFLHTITGAAGGGNIVLNLVASTAQVFLPAVSVNIALNQTPSVAQVFQPTIGRNIALNRVDSVNNVYLLSLSGEAIEQDLSDILDRYNRKKSESKEEENIAAQLLKARQKRPQVRKEYKQVLDWKKLIYTAIYGAETLEQLEAIDTTSIPTDSPETVRAILAEIEQAKEARRLELKLKMEEAALQAYQLESQISAKIEEQRQAVEAIRQLQKEIVAKHQIAVKTAEEAYKESLLEFQVAEEKAVEFTRKRNNRIKRIKALMWLTKLDI